ncbi:TetR family transcriptional regulator [Aneurinibacillus soli]|uniref:Putative acrEF/envCD operon repressor n=1 Tax=Aneurinibacillus soli TaxID=1500254 RepID=A0A0U5AYI5_9BACL|nr:TetR/AcrR family transcriptional regulator [Aneurinibacillus soli]PYE63105.1 TetR family transcriptional regulator [Aneurinibacillus soli]BAU28837.1 putative acrEF/envCD operon repressor [Aneurinibacillus soli]
MEGTLNETREKILQATITLMREKGIKAMTTRSIAEAAGVNEVTLFRHFGNKAGLIGAAVAAFSYVPSITKAFQETITWNLEHDLYLFSKAYFDVMEQNRDVIVIGFKEADQLPELQEEIAKIPRQLKVLLIEYLTEMQRRGHVIETNIEAQAMHFIWTNFGYFISRARFQQRITTLTHDEFIRSCLHIFARGLTP